MGLHWIHESPAVWDPPKRAILEAAPEGSLPPLRHEEGELVPGEWWRVETGGGEVAGYGWMDHTWGDAEILLAVHPDHRGRGVGTFILDRLEREAAGQGLNYLYNVVRPTHPDPRGVAEWLRRRGFRASDDGSLRRQVGHGGKPASPV